MTLPLRSDFESDKRFCPTCKDYVCYLLAVDQGYCVQCGEKVRVFSPDDAEELKEVARGKDKPKKGKKWSEDQPKGVPDPPRRGRK